VSKSVLDGLLLAVKIAKHFRARDFRLIAMLRCLSDNAALALQVDSCRAAALSRQYRRKREMSDGVKQARSGFHQL
jgi:hypothetical protein